MGDVLLANIHFGIHHNSEVLFDSVPAQSAGSEPVLVNGIVSAAELYTYNVSYGLLILNVPKVLLN